MKNKLLWAPLLLIILGVVTLLIWPERAGNLTLIIMLAAFALAALAVSKERKG